MSGETIHALENKTRTLKDEQTHLEVQIKLHKSNAALREERLEKLLAMEKMCSKQQRNNFRQRFQTPVRSSRTVRGNSKANLKKLTD